MAFTHDDACAVAKKRAETVEEWRAVHEWLCCMDCGDVECFEHACSDSGITTEQAFVEAMDAPLV